MSQVTEFWPRPAGTQQQVESTRPPQTAVKTCPASLEAEGRVAPSGAAVTLLVSGCFSGRVNGSCWLKAQLQQREVQQEEGVLTSSVWRTIQWLTVASEFTNNTGNQNSATRTWTSTSKFTPAANLTPSPAPLSRVTSLRPSPPPRCPPKSAPAASSFFK